MATLTADPGAETRPVLTAEDCLRRLVAQFPGVRFTQSRPNVINWHDGPAATTIAEYLTTISDPTVSVERTGTVIIAGTPRIRVIRWLSFWNAAKAIAEKLLTGQWLSYGQADEVDVDRANMQAAQDLCTRMTLPRQRNRPETLAEQVLYTLLDDELGLMADACNAGFVSVKLLEALTRNPDLVHAAERI